MANLSYTYSNITSTSNVPGDDSLSVSDPVLFNAYLKSVFYDETYSIDIEVNIVYEDPITLISTISPVNGISLISKDYTFKSLNANTIRIFGTPSSSFGDKYIFIKDSVIETKPATELNPGNLIRYQMPQYNSRLIESILTITAPNDPSLGTGIITLNTSIFQWLYWRTTSAEITIQNLVNR